jgi:hypothetical protein
VVGDAVNTTESIHWQTVAAALRGDQVDRERVAAACAWLNFF